MIDISPKYAETLVAQGGAGVERIGASVISAFRMWASTVHEHAARPLRSRPPMSGRVPLPDDDGLVAKNPVRLVLDEPTPRMWLVK